MCCFPWQPRAHKHTQTQCVLYSQESPRVPKAASPAEPGAHVQISHSLVCFPPVLTEQPPALFTLCCSRLRIICVLRSFSGLPGAVASTHFANSCLPSVHISELRGGTKGPFYRGETLSSFQDFWLPGWRWQSPDFPKHAVLLRGFHVQGTAPLCTREHPLVQTRSPPLLCLGVHKAGHRHSDSNSSLGQSKPWAQEQPLATPAAARDTTSLLRSSPAPHFLEPPSTSSSSPHPGTALVLQEVPRAGQEHADPHPQHLPVAPSLTQSTHKPKHNTQLGLTLKAAVLRRARPHTPAGSSPSAGSSEQLQLLYHLLLLCQVPLPS